MARLADGWSHARETLAELQRLSWGELSLLHREDAILGVSLLVVCAVGGLVVRAVWLRGPGRHGVALPALPPLARRSPFSPLRHAAFATFLAGLPFFFAALADPRSALVHEEVSYPGHRMAILIDASISMNTAFATERLGSGNAFLANVAAAEYFVRRRMEGPYRDLVSLVEFGSEAYIVTPFTNDYENILLSISLIGTPAEYRRFPDHGTLIMGAISRGVQLFRTFDFLKASGNLIVIFSDGEDSRVIMEGMALDEVLQEAADNAIPVYFIRTSYGQDLGDVVPDQLWKEAVERTGGRFFPAANEAMIIEAVHEIDRISVGRIRSRQYAADEPRFAPFALGAILAWSLALAFTLGVKHLRTFP